MAYRLETEEVIPGLALFDDDAVPLLLVKSLSSMYMRFPPVIPGNWTWTLVEVTWRIPKLEFRGCRCRRVRSSS